MSLAEATRARGLVLSVIFGKNLAMQEEDVDWRNVAARVAMVVFAYGAFFVLKRRLSCPKKRDASIDARQMPDSAGEGTDCPICLESLRAGVVAGCGHRLCARCLLDYCHAKLDKPTSGDPPPCPLCRAPIVSVSLVYHQSGDRGSANAVDPEIADWLGKYNARAGRLPRVPAEESAALADNGMIFVKLLFVSIVVCVLARCQSLPGTVDFVAYSSFFVTAFSMTLMVYLSLRCQELAALEAD